LPMMSICTTCRPHDMIIRVSRLDGALDGTFSLLSRRFPMSTAAHGSCGARRANSQKPLCLNVRNRVTKPACQTCSNNARETKSATHFGKKHGRQQLWRMPERKSGLDFWKRLGSVVDTSDLAGVALAKGRCTRWKRGHVFEQPALGGPFSGVCVCGSEIMIGRFLPEKSKLYFLS